MNRTPIINTNTGIKKPLFYGSLLLLFLLVVATILLASVPPVDRDALTHHLFVPKLWLQHGGIYEIPEIPFSYYPMNLDLLYTIALYFGNDIVPKYIHYCFALLTALLLYFHLKKRLGTLYALFGALFFLSVPIIIKLSITVYVDLGLVFFTTASLLLLLHWADKGFQLRWLLLAGLSCGLAAGTKYNGLIAIVVLTLFVPIIYQRSSPNNKQHNGKALLWGFAFAVATFTSFSPWMVRNYFWTGNPIYPLHNGLFQSISTKGASSGEQLEQQSSKLNQEQKERSLDSFTARKVLYQETWWQALLLPVRFFFEGQDDNPQYFDGKLSPFLLILPFFALLNKAESAQIRREKKALLAFAILTFFFIFFQNVLRIRYVVCIVPPLVILATYGLQAICSWLSSANMSALHYIRPALILGLPASVLMYNCNYIVQQWHSVQPIAYLDGTTTRDAYISRFRTEYPAVQFINNEPGTTKTLALFLGNRGYYFNGPVQFDAGGEKSFLCEIIKKAGTEEQVADALTADAITHLLIRYDLFNQLITEQLDAKAQERLMRFLQMQATLVYENNGYGLFRIIKQSPSL